MIHALDILPNGDIVARDRYGSTSILLNTATVAPAVATSLPHPIDGTPAELWDWLMRSVQDASVRIVSISESGMPLCGADDSRAKAEERQRA